MKAYNIITGSHDQLDLVKPLWEQLNHLHFELSPHFKHRFKTMTWEARKANLLAKSREVFFEYVKDDSENIIAYCISTIDKTDNQIGEIDSIFIIESYRKTGLGKQLIDNALAWLDSNKVETQKIVVGVGNEEVLEYYHQFNFYPLHIVLQRDQKHS